MLKHRPNDLYENENKCEKKKLYKNDNSINKEIGTNINTIGHDKNGTNENVKKVDIMNEKANILLNTIKNEKTISNKIKSKINNEVKTEIKIKIREEIINVLQKSYVSNILSVLTFLSILYNLQEEKMYRNKRSIYYDCVSVFKSQDVVDRLIARYMRKFECTMYDLYIKASLKGIFYGELIFYYKNGVIQECYGKNIIPDMTEVSGVENRCKTVLVVEKDSVFSHVTDESLIVVCGKGYPCHNTTQLLNFFSYDTRIFCLTDFDPHGIEIFLTYKERVGRIVRTGIKAGDLFKYKIRKIEAIPLNKWDQRKAQSIRKRRLSLNEKAEIEYDLDFMEAIGFKIELEAIVLNDTFNIIDYLKAYNN